VLDLRRRDGPKEPVTAACGWVADDCCDFDSLRRSALLERECDSVFDGCLSCGLGGVGERRLVQAMQAVQHLRLVCSTEEAQSLDMRVWAFCFRLRNLKQGWRLGRAMSGCNELQALWTGGGRSGMAARGRRAASDSLSIGLKRSNSDSDNALCTCGRSGGRYRGTFCRRRRACR
jgi:hypothetical protein